ncbi:6522_t:CDS:2 [Gigaspora margarita]|uniref:6522_t:CDS:1 n=1 Tax=Gigaspora margarita TaxID=4874 RepID=A0ABN7UFU0_GIGMA|nr:6522_t:CDS:2 [Gigaspora margarita]
MKDRDIIARDVTITGDVTIAAEDVIAVEDVIAEDLKVLLRYFNSKRYNTEDIIVKDLVSSFQTTRNFVRDILIAEEELLFDTVRNLADSFETTRTLIEDISTTKDFEIVVGDFLFTEQEICFLLLFVKIEIFGHCIKQTNF